MTPTTPVRTTERAAAPARHATRFHHELAHDPRLDLGVLAAVVDELPAKLVEHHRADLPLVLPQGNPERLDLPPSAVVTGLRDNGCWLIAGQSEHLDGHAELLDDVAAAVTPLFPRSEGTIVHRHVNLLLGSPGAVVPVHFDRHHNFILQVTGTKRVTVAADDDGVVTREIDHCFDADENPRVLPLHSETFELTPGDGVYIPPYAFHWVEGGDDVSVSVSCEVRTSTTVRTQLAHECNARLRRLRLRPRAPGRSQRVDVTKAAALRAWWQARRRVQALVHR